MRFQEFVDQALVPIATSKFTALQDLAKNVSGGWEPWLQIEMYLQLKNKNAMSVLNREAKYSSSGQIAGFSYKPSNSDGMTIWVELKVQTNNNAAYAIDNLVNITTCVGIQFLYQMNRKSN